MYGEAGSAAFDETRRQQVLDRYRIVDSLPDGAYDDIVQIASTVCEVPIAVVTLIDRDRQWFKARIGLDAHETPRSAAVCDVAIRKPGEILEVHDLSQDARFAQYPVVTELGARFYAGMPLVTPEGAPLGTVCVLDHEPRRLSSEQKQSLEALARLAARLMETRSHAHEQEVAALLSSNTPAEASGTSAPYTIVLIELQGYAAAVKQRGERGVEKELHQLEMQLEAALAREIGDTINRVTGSAEFVAVLHGEDASERLMALEAILGTQRHRTGLHLLLASAAAESGDEPAQHVFVRADAALSARKDAAAHALQAA